jgi:non-specific protein-tyrosine kinase
MAASFIQTPVYSANAELLLQPKSTESLFDSETGQRRDPERGVQTEIEVLKSRPVQEAVKQKLGASPEILVSPVGQTDVIEVRSESTDPERAATVANTYATEYIDFRRKQAVDDLIAAGNEIQTKVTDLQRQIDAIDPRATDRRTSLLEQQALFKQKQDQLQVDAALKTGGAQLVTQAAAPTSPIRPTPARSAVLATMVGLILGVGLAFMFEHLDDSIKGREDIERAVGGLPVLGLVPLVANWKDRGRPMVVSIAEPKSSAAEAYRALRTSVQFMGLDRPLRIIQMTSPAASEGKSTTLANLAVALAQAGERVVMVDCDLRRPRIHHFFGLSNDVGFTSVLVGDAPLSSALQSVEGQDRLRLLASGPVPPNPSELLSGRRAAEIFSALQAESDIVLVDCPPVLPVTDATVLAGRVNATLLVATSGTTSRSALQHAYGSLRQVDAPVIGTVLNGITSEGGYGYGYGYGYQYGYAEEPASNGSEGDGQNRRDRSKASLKKRRLGAFTPR